MREGNEAERGENRLQYEKSPYLLQHARDPVHWWSWCPGAFREAERMDKPVFLSIGYSTCHWCHVMGRETFRDAEAAELLNREFVAVKVDREERPDIDAVYMEACQMLTGSGGWPLTILMTPDQKPFWAGTYLPPRGRDGFLGLVELLDEVSRLWRSDRRRLLDLGQEVARRLAREAPASPAEPGREALREAVQAFRRRFDEQNGGFGAAPKFPSAHDLLFLLACGRAAGDEQAREMALKTLTQMARGGIFDQLGGGFCRYSTDAAWRVPHYEKMLCDNAMLACAYLEAYTQTGQSFYRDTARRTLDYVLSELVLPEGGCACGQDADSCGEEGKYYLLTSADVEEALGTGKAQEVCQRLSVTEDASMPQLLDDPRYASFRMEHEEDCKVLATFRRRRWPLHRDEKALTSWNAMMIAAFAKADRVLGDEKYLQAARDVRQFLKNHLTAPGGRLLHCWRGGEAAVDGQLDDYAFCCWALTELYETDFDPEHLREAAELADRMLEDFLDTKSGGFYRTSHKSERLIARRKEIYDSGTPSGNAAAGLALAKLARITGEPRFFDASRKQLAWLAGAAKEYPAASSFALLAMMEELYPSKELVCVSKDRVPGWLAGVGETYRLTAVAKTRANSQALARQIPRTVDYPIPEEGAAYYLCRSGACEAPVTDLAALRTLLLREFPGMDGGDHRLYAEGAAEAESPAGSSV